MELPKISEEQKAIVDSIDQVNVAVDSVAGSGKTTTNLHIATKYPNKSCLLLTYNKKLKSETREKVKELKLTNLQVHSYHSFCVRYYDNNCFTDYQMINMLNLDMPAMFDFLYDIIIVDEAQDMSPLYFRLVQKIIRECEIVPKLLILGDKFQSIYDFNGADSRFISYANKVFPGEWKFLNLSHSFRITNTMAGFINSMMGYTRIKSNKKSKYKPRYLTCNTFRTGPYKEIQYYINAGYKYKDIFVLSPSVKSNKNPARKLANRLSKEGVPIYVPASDEERIDEDILRGKLVFSTFHQVKGLERKVIIVLNFDQTYFDYFKKDADPHILPNELYVAITRAKERLTVIHHNHNKALLFANTEYCDCIVQNKLNDKKKRNSPPKSKMSVTQLIRHLPAIVVHNCLQYITSTQINSIGKKIDIAFKSKQGKLFEAVSEITGTAIPAYYEYKQTGSMSISNYKNPTTKDLLREANRWNCEKNGYYFKLKQINKYDWLSKKTLDLCCDRLGKLNISNKAIFEEFATVEFKNKIINGYADCVDGDTLYEFKCTSAIEAEHLLQLALYMFLFECKTYRIYNIFSEEMFELSASREKLKEMMAYLINYKFTSLKKTDDEEFLEKYGLNPAGNNSENNKEFINKG